MAKESEAQREARLARRALDIQREATAEMRASIREALTALDAVVVGESLPQRDARVRGAMEAALAVTVDSITARRIAAAADAPAPTVPA